jgi:dihydrofolate reductase
MTHIALIAAVARNGVIGGDNQLLWRLKTDLQHFRKLTLGKPVIMGRKTFASIGKPLPGRDTVLLTRDASVEIAGVTVAHSIDEALKMAGDLAAARGDTDIMVAGGGEIYRQTMALADRLYVTEVALEPTGDAFFPAIDPEVWRVTAREAHMAGPDDEANLATRLLTFGLRHTISLAH